jgi:hypothetical protein
MFDQYECHCSSLGLLMPNLEKITPNQELKIAELCERKEKAKAFEAKPLTANMEDELAKLVAQRDAPDVLPAGAISKLDEIFREVVWKRKRILENRYLSKGLYGEEDSIDLISYILGGKLIVKNKERKSNGFITGECDVNDKKIHDAKSNWDLDTFDNSELSSIYKWQLKGYCWLYDKEEAELNYCLVNAPEHLIYAEKQKLFYAMNSPGDDNELYLQRRQQIERNMIFDISAFRRDYPNYDFDNTNLGFSMPKCLRIKSFDVKLEAGDVDHIKRRVELSRNYLNDKFNAIQNKINQEAEQVAA